MRISLLRQREPFCRILEQTLTRYFQWEWKQTFEVKWRERGDQDSARNGRERTQRLLVNEYLNVIFDPSLSADDFDPIRREFSRSAVAWRRPIQRAYVHCAIRRPTSAWLAHARLEITPAVPQLARLLLVPGNQKLRILDRAQGICTSVLKSDFRDDAMRAEIKARELAHQLKIRVPETISSDIENGVIRERYVSATPLNRLADAQLARHSLAAATQSIRALVEATQHTEPLSRYLARLVSEVSDRLDPYEPQNQQSVEKVSQVVHLLQNVALEAADTDASIRVSMTHGDFQPANILVNGEGTWLIDWENSRERQSGYDWLVYESGVRRDPAFAERLLRLTQVAPPPWTGITFDTRADRIRHIAIFLLEEIATKLNEVAHPAIPALGDGFLTLVDEVTKWQNETAKKMTNTP